MNKLVALVLAACVALAAGQKDKIELPAPLNGAANDYALLAGQKPTCEYLPTVFESNWTDTTTGCNAAATLWTAAKAAVKTAAWFPLFAPATVNSLTTCNAAADAETGNGVTADGKLICKYIADIANACACARLQCVTPKVNEAVTADTFTTCSQFAAGACVHYKSLIESTCTAAFAVRPTFSETRVTDYERPETFPETCDYSCPAAVPSTPSGAAGVSSSAGVVIAAAAAALGASML